MAKDVSVTLKLVDKISKKLDDIANSADKAFSKFSDLCDRMDRTFERFTSTADNLNSSMRTAVSAVSDYAEQGSRAVRGLEEQAQAADDAAQALDGQAGAADDAVRALEEQADAADELTQALEEHTEAADRTSQALEEQADLADRASQALEEQADLADDAVRAMEEQANAAEEVIQTLEIQTEATDRVSQALEEQVDLADDAVRALEEQADAAERNADALGGLGDALGGLDDDLDGLDDDIDNTTRAAMDLGDALTAAGIAIALDKIKNAYFDCDAAADKFESAMAKVGTIADTEALSLTGIQSQIQKLSMETGVSVSDLAESTYSAISASVNTADAVAFVAQANSLAVGGFTQTTTAVDILTTALNAYGLEASETSNVADMMIQTQNLGKTSVDELAGSMGKIIPTANSLNVQLDVLCGSYAVMTANGIATAETTTYMNSMLNELGKNGTSAANALKEGTEHIKEGGLTMAEAMESGMSLTDVLAVLDERARESGTSISNMFGSAEAGKAANVLWGNAQKVDDAIAQMGNSAGAAQTAFEKMSDTGEFVKQKWENSLENLKIAIGNAQPSLDGLMQKGTEIINKLSEFVSEHPAVVGAIEGMAVALGAFTVAMGAYTAATLLAGKATEIFKAAMKGPAIFIVTAALAALTAGIAVFVGSMGEAEEAEEKLTGTSLKLSNEIARQEAAVEALKAEYGATNEKTLEAKAKLEELKAEYKETESTIDEFNARIQNTIDSVEESTAAYNENSAKLDEQSFYAMSLVTELEKLQSQAELTAFQQQYEKKVVSELNAIYPKLGLSYDEASRKLGDSTDYLKKYCEQKNEELKLEQDAEQYAEYLSKKNELMAQLAEAQQNLTDATEEYNRLTNEVSNNDWGNTLLDSGYDDAFDKAMAAGEAMQQAQADIDTLTKAIDETQSSMDALGQSAIDAANNVGSIGGASDNLISTTADLRVAMEGVFKGVQEQSEKLAAAYLEACNAAASAVDSSFGMFEKIKLETDLTTQQMIDAWDSQTKYLLEYADNIQKAKEYGIDASLVESLADGSQESAAALDTIISKIEDLGDSTDAAKGFIEDMNNSFKIREDAKKTLEDSIIDVNVSLQTKMEELKESMESGIDELNLSSAAASAAEETMAAYISSIVSMGGSAAEAAAGVSAAVEAALSSIKVTSFRNGKESGNGVVSGVVSTYPAISKAYTKAADIGDKACRQRWEINSPSKVFKESAKYTIEGIVEGVEENQNSVFDTYEGLAGMVIDRYQDGMIRIGAVTEEYLGLASEKFGQNSEEMAKAMDFVIDKLSGLKEAYNENYESAYQSISGQLGLFNDVEFGTSKSIDEMMNSLKKQADYMAEYGAYMYKAMEMGVDDGILDKLSDGSSESAAILKEIVTNGSNKIDELNASFAKVEEGKKTFSTVMAELETYYGGELDKMVNDLEKAVGDMEQYDAAYNSAEKTCQGIIDGIEAKKDAVVGKMEELSRAMLNIQLPVMRTAPDIGNIVSEHAAGTTYGEDVYIAGEYGPELIVGRRGSEVFPASETAKILSAVMARRTESDISMPPQEIMNTIIHENNSSNTNTENRNMTLTINGKGSIGVGQEISRKEVVNYIKNELEGAIMDIITTQLYEEGMVSHEY